MAQLLPLGTDRGKSFIIFSIKPAKCLQEESEQCKVVDHYKPEFFSGLIFTIAQGFYSLVGRESPEVMSPETWAMLPEILAMSPEKKVKPEETNTKKIIISDC